MSDAVLRWFAGDGWPIGAGLTVAFLADGWQQFLLTLVFLLIFTFLCDVVAPCALRRRSQS